MLPLFKYACEIVSMLGLGNDDATQTAAVTFELIEEIVEIIHSVDSK